MNELALFAGAGGGLLGTRLLGWRSICYVEKDPYCVRVLQARIKDGYLDDAPIWDDVRTFEGKAWAGLVDVITAGFPCQPFSGAGLQLGERDERNLWYDTLRIIREVRPEWFLLENVSRLLSNAYIRRIFADLAESGYDARWDCIPACAVGANHQRDRVWIVGHAQGARDGSVSVRSRRQEQTDSIDAYRTSKNVSNTDDERQSAEVQYIPWLSQQKAKPVCDGKVQSVENATSHRRHGSNSSQYQDIWQAERDGSASDIGGSGGAMANANIGGLQESKDEQEGQTTLPVRPNIGRCDPVTWWNVEPDVGRVAYGVAHRVDRLRAIGNGQVPIVAATAWRLLSGEIK